MSTNNRRTGKPSKKQTAEKEKTSPILRWIIWPIVAVIILLVVFVLMGNMDGAYTITGDDSFIEVGYDGTDPVYLIVSDLPKSNVTTPDGRGTTNSLSVEVAGQTAHSFVGSTTAYKVLLIDKEGNITSPNDYDTEQLKAKLQALISEYETVPAEALGDYDFKIRELLGIHNGEPN
ncbi:MAG: hypothetical protein R3C11_17975 [Planctomycetaceae bacterium]